MNASCSSGDFCPLVPLEVIQAKLSLLGCSNYSVLSLTCHLKLALSYFPTHRTEFTFKLSKCLVGGYFSEVQINAGLRIPSLSSGALPLLLLTEQKTKS